MKSKPEPKISTEQLCRDYYKCQIFGSDGFFEIQVIHEIRTVDNYLFYDKVKDSNILLRELDALHIELFGLAWLSHNFRLVLSGELEQYQADSAVCTEITFTKAYLESMEHGEIWSAAGFYSDTIMKAVITQDNSLDWSVSPDNPSNYYSRDVPLFPHDIWKDDMENMRKHYEKLSIDRECVQRLLNRTFACRDEGNVGIMIGLMISQKLALAFAHRLSLSPNSELLFLLQRVTVGLYKNAREYINAVEDYGSWELAKNAGDAFIEHLIKVAQKRIEKQRSSEGPKLS